MLSFAEAQLFDGVFGQFLYFRILWLFLFSHLACLDALSMASSHKNICAFEK